MSNINTLTEIVEKQWSRNINKKVNTTKRLIEFKSTIKQKNTKLIKILRNTSISNHVKESQVIAVKKELISYIGTWIINAQQKLVSYKKIKSCLGYFICSEYSLLQPLLNNYLKDKSYLHYSDAICCQHLFNRCFK